MTNPVPEGVHTVTPHLTIRGASQAIEFYKRAFSAVEIARHAGPDGKSVMHADLQIGNSRIFLAEEVPSMGSKGPHSLKGTPVVLHLYVPDTDLAFKQAVQAGAKTRMPPMDMFWGDRYGQVEDPFGHVWAIATHKEDLTPQELATRSQAAMANMPKPPRAKPKPRSKTKKAPPKRGRTRSRRR
jgi:PhnB protein